ncbi:hypothetical protein GCM10028819_30390 [Spirosoma humi]
MKTLLLFLVLLSAVLSTASGQGNLSNAKSVGNAPKATPTNLPSDAATMLVNVGHYNGEARTLVADYIRSTVTMGDAKAGKVNGGAVSAISKQGPIVIGGLKGNAALESYVFGESATAESSGLSVIYDSNPVDWYLHDLAGGETSTAFFALKITYRACENGSVTSKNAALNCIIESYTNAKYHVFDIDLTKNPEWLQRQRIRAMATAYNFDVMYNYKNSVDYFKNITHPDFLTSAYAIQFQSLDDAFFQLAVKNDGTDGLFSDERRYVNTDPKYQTAPPMFDAALYSSQKKVSFMLIK